MIELKKVTKIYNKNKSNSFTALKNIDLTINDNDYAVILGKSGAGKSTLLHIIGCIDDFEGGSVIIDGVDITNAKNNQLAKMRNKEIGIVFQDFALIPDYTIYENVEIPLIFAGIKSKRRKEMCNAAIKKVGLQDFKNKLAGELSGGQKQRVAIARAIANDPKYIFADEPTGALDSKTASDILGIFKNLNENGKTVVIITHDESIVSDGNRKIILADGEIVTDN